MEKVAADFFAGLFQANRQRRLALCYRFLCVYRREFDDPIQLCRFYLQVFACETPAFQLERTGMRLTRGGFYIPYAWLTADEQDTIKWFIDHCDTLFDHVEWDEREYELRKANLFKFDHLVLPPLHRRLLIRDYCTMCILQCQMNANPRVPTYALLACKDLLLKDGDNTLLKLAHTMLDGVRANAHEIPVVNWQ